MKVALCLIGMIGGKDGKYGLNQSSEVLEVGFKHYNKHFLEKNDVDVFCHTSSLDFKEEVLSLYKPKNYLFLEEPTFTIPRYVTGERQRRQAHYHRWFSYQVVSDLRRKHEEETGTKYDFVYIGRYDIAWQIDVDFSLLDKGKFYSANWNRLYKNGQVINNNDWYSSENEFLIEGELSERQKEKGYESKLVGYPHNDEGFIDQWFISNPDYMDSFCTLFKHLDDYTKPGKSWDKGRSSLVDAAGNISNHRLAPAHLEKIGLLDKLDFKFHLHDDFPLVRRMVFKRK